MTVIFPEEAMAVLETLIFVSSKPVTAALSRITGYDEKDVEMLLEQLAELYECWARLEIKPSCRWLSVGYPS